MADSEIQPAAAAASSSEPAEKNPKSKSKSKSESKKRPDDAVKLGCGGFFRRRKKKSAGKDGDAVADTDVQEQKSKAPIEKPKRPEQKPTTAVQLEDSPHSELWSKIVSNSLVGIGVFSRAAVCNLTTGGVLATYPADYAPTPGQVAALCDNFDSRGAALSSAGFGIGRTVYRLQEETSTQDIICGVNSDDTEGVLVTRTNTALLACAYTKDLDQAMEVLSEMRSNFIGQGM